MLSASCGSSQDVKVLKNSNTNSDNASKNNTKFSDANKESAGREENNRDNENENCDDERDVGDTDGGDVETKNNGAESEKCDAGGDGAETTSRNRCGDGNKKRAVATALDDSGYATGCDVNSAFSSNNNNNDGTWSEEIDYISLKHVGGGCAGF
ncbi:hypothetical protein KOW79_021514 [Hemibagrus wyckioides]|uniref:Uncharacterized protein n=1 Tax=Hemibagrus wyckioides TaxID=337641 RepID=A0A9D3S8P3_9TELE|nr:hypothetical protein KOW79_021514 [Hemibagrus wyckioides]